MQRCVLALLVALALAFALSLQTASAQQPRDPLIDPPSGGAGSRFQIVGQYGWTPGETVTLRVLFTTSGDPLNVAPQDAPLSQEFSVTVLADGTWSFPLVVAEFFAADGGATPPETPGYIVVQARSATHTAVNAYIFTVDNIRPLGAGAIASAGWGPTAAPAGFGLTLALFAAGLGTLLVVSGGLRRMRSLG